MTKYKSGVGKRPRQIYDYVSAVGGLYMRYSDDFIIVLPRKKNQDSVVILKQILTMFNDIPGVTLQVETNSVLFL
jgi:hypothetical protein